MKTKPTKKKQIKRNWHLVDVENKILGRIAVEIASFLRGKNKPYFVPHLDCGDYVVVTNASSVQVSGKKEKQKVYTRYTGYPGGLRKETLENLRKRKPEDIIRNAVSGMLPKNKLHKLYMAKLYVFAGKIHSFDDKFKNQSKT